MKQVQRAFDTAVNVGFAADDDAFSRIQEILVAMKESLEELKKVYQPQKRNLDQLQCVFDTATHAGVTSDDDKVYDSAKRFLALLQLDKVSCAYQQNESQLHELKEAFDIATEMGWTAEDSVY